MFDIRCRHSSDHLLVFHGPVYQHLNFTDVCRAFYDFLDKYPTECIIMSLKKEGEDDPEGTFAETFMSYIHEGRLGHWYFGDLVPTLGEVRGKIVLFRRFERKGKGIPDPLGINAHDGWENDKSFTIRDPNGVVIHVQDQYDVPTIFDIDKKWDHVKSLIKRAAGESHWCINFTSGSSGGAYPYTVAKGAPFIEGVNKHLHEYVDDHEGHFGTFLMDFPEWPESLISRVISKNHMVLKILSSGEWSSGWTAWAPFTIGNVQYYLDYKEGNGYFKFQQITDDGAGYQPIANGTWTAGWTIFMPFYSEGNAYYLNYKQGTGGYNLQQIFADGSYNLLASGSLASGLTSLMPFYIAGTPYCLAYNALDGSFQFLQIVFSAEGGVTLQELSQGKWTSGWTSWVPFTIDGTPYYLNYKEATGEYNFQQITEDGSGYTLIKSGSWTTGWTLFMPFYGDCHPFYLNYKQESGEYNLQEIHADGSYTLLESGAMASGFTSLMPFSLHGDPYCLAYNAGNGDFQFIRLVGVKPARQETARCQIGRVRLASRSV
jgi:1-phosphatidylinositol phosphodiesterase